MGFLCKLKAWWKVSTTPILILAPKLNMLDSKFFVLQNLYDLLQMVGGRGGETSWRFYINWDLKNPDKKHLRNQELSYNRVLEWTISTGTFYQNYILPWSYIIVYYKFLNISKIPKIHYGTINICSSKTTKLGGSKYFLS